MKFTVGLLAALTLAGCAHPFQRLESTANPGHPVLSFRNDSGSSTSLLSSFYSVQSGVDGRIMTIATFDGEKALANLVTMDAFGDIGVSGGITAIGSIATVSTRAAKRDVRPYRDDPLAVLDRTHIVTYRYRSEASATSAHVGFIAEDTPASLAGSRHDRFDVGNTLAVETAATKALDTRVRALEKRLDAMLAETASSP